MVQIMNDSMCGHQLYYTALNSASSSGNERKDCLSEIEMMKKVAEGQNPHIVHLLGCVTIKEPLTLIIEFIQYGDLLSYLRTNRKIVICSRCYQIHDFTSVHVYYNSALEPIQKTMKEMMLMLSWVMYLLWILSHLPTKSPLEWFVFFMAIATTAMQYVLL